MTAPCGRTGTVTVACGRIADGSCWICRTPPKPGRGVYPPVAPLLATTARVPDRSSSGATGAEPGPALHQDAAGNFWPLPLTADVPAHGGTGSHASLAAMSGSGQGRPSPTRRPRSTRTVRVPGRRPGPYATFGDWYAATDGARPPDEPDKDKPTHRIGCPWDLLVVLAAVLAVFLLTFVVGWLLLKGSGVLP